MNATATKNYAACASPTHHTIRGATPITFVFQTLIPHPNHSRDLSSLSNLAKSFCEFWISLEEVHLSFACVFI